MQNNNVHILSIQKYLAEVQDVLLKHILDNQKALLLAPMGAGKTTFLEKSVTPKAKELGKWVVLVIPGVAQLREMRLRGIETVCEGAGCSGDRMFYATTPDSLHKVWSKAKAKQVGIWLVVDEAHACVTSSNFRKVFLEIDKFAEIAEKVIRLTATAEPLEGMNLGPILDVRREQNPTVKLTVQPVKKTNADTIYQVAANKYVQGEMLFTHYNNIKGNKFLAEKLSSLIQKEEEKVLLEDAKQLNFNAFGEIENSEIEFKIIDKTNKAVSLFAKNKDHPVAKALVRGKMPQDVAIVTLTSFVKEGMNILNAKPSTVIIVWDSTLTFAELIQTIGRYRNQENIKEIIVLVQKAPAEWIDYKPFETLLEISLECTQKILEAITFTAKVDKKMALELAKTNSIVYNQDLDEWRICELSLRNRVYAEYSKRLRMAPSIIKKELEACAAINLQVQIADVLKDVEDNGIAEQILELKKEQKEAFAELSKKMLEYDDLTLQEILDHTVSAARPELKEAFEMQEEYHNIVRRKFKEALSQIVKYEEISTVEAFRKLVASGRKNYKPIIEEARTKMVNRAIEQEGLEVALQKFSIFKTKKDTEVIARIAFIRTYLKKVEKKRGRIGEKLKKELAAELIKQGYYGYAQQVRKIAKEKDPNIQKIIESECKTKSNKEKIQYALRKHIEYQEKLLTRLVNNDLEKVAPKLTQDLSNIYVFREDLISSVKT